MTILPQCSTSPRRPGRVRGFIRVLIHRSSSSQARNFSAGNEVIDYRVGDTPIALKIQLMPEISLASTDLARTLIQTQLQLRRYLASHYRADEDVLFHFDDPYSLKEDLPGCFFAVTHWPADRTRRLTYGMVDVILTGVINVFWKGEHFVGADIYVVHDYMGMVGAAQVSRARPSHSHHVVAVV